METSEWQEIMHEIGVERLYVEPGRHAQENGYAEAAVKTVESVVKNILMSANLSPGYWQSAAACRCRVSAQSISCVKRQRGYSY